MTMVQTKGKSVPEIMHEKRALAAQGSCKTCQFCLKVSDPATELGEFYCGIQDNVNPISFQKAQLESEAYPYGPCEDGNWSEVEDDGSRKQIQGCLAYVPRVIDGVSYGDAEVRKQWAFMHCLSEAAKLHYAIEDVRSGKAQVELDKLLERLNTGDFSNYGMW